jgi:YHS domain-containing protein
MLSFLVRVILFAIAISALRSVINMVQRAFSGGRTQQPTVRATRGAPNSPQPAADTMLQQDPVCGTYVAVDTSLKRVVNGRVIHFCSPECRDKYAA